MRIIVTTVGAIIIIAILGGFAFVYSGLFDVAATERHWPLTQWVLETARTRSIKAHATGIEVPAGLGDEAKLVMGTEHFAAHCAVCHGAPGVPKGDIAQGLYPQPPDLAQIATHYSEAELFWIIKHGIKMTGMPAWADHSDEEVWATVVFLRKLPGMTQDDYAKLVMASMAHGGHRREGGEGTPPAAVLPAAPQKGDAHQH
jgi:mono/diheme cytochrome c family protein